MRTIGVVIALAVATTVGYNLAQLWSSLARVLENLPH